MPDDDRVEGSMKKIKGDLKEGAGKILGDSKMQAEGKGDREICVFRDEQSAVKWLIGPAACPDFELSQKM